MAEQFVPDGPHARLMNNDGWVKLMNWQHSTMYLFYGISGIADILCATSPFAPQGLDSMALSLALFVEGLVTSSEARRTNIDIRSIHNEASEVLLL